MALYRMTANCRITRLPVILFRKKRIMRCTRNPSLQRSRPRLARRRSRPVGRHPRALPLLQSGAWKARGLRTQVQMQMQVQLQVQVQVQMQVQVQVQV